MHPQKFWFGETENPWIPRPIPWKSGQNLWKHLCKKWQPTWFDLKKMVPSVKFGGHLKWRCSWSVSQEENICTSGLKFFWGKFGKIQAKILRTPKNLPAPTPMCIYQATYRAGVSFLLVRGPHILLHNGLRAGLLMQCEFQGRLHSTKSTHFSLIYNFFIIDKLASQT